MTCSIGNCAFKTNETSTIWCHRKAPQAKFKTLGLSVAVQWIALFHMFVFISAYKSRLKEPGIPRGTTKAKWNGHVSESVWQDQKKITKNQSFSIGDYAIKTDTILTMWCRLLPPEGPPGSPREPPEPPWIFRGTTKVKWNGHVSGIVWKDIKNITKDMTCSIGKYAFKTNKISTIWCHRRAPHAKFGSLGLSLAVQWIALVHFVFSFLPIKADSKSLGYSEALQKPEEMVMFQEACEKT